MQTDAVTRFIKTVFPNEIVRQFAALIVLIWAMTIFTLAGLGFISLAIPALVSETVCVVLIGWGTSYKKKKTALQGGSSDENVNNN